MRSAALGLLGLLSGCGPGGVSPSLQPIASPSPGAVDLGATTVLDLVWPQADLLIGTRRIPGTQPVRRELVTIDRATGTTATIEIVGPPECPSIDAMMPRVIDGELVFDRYCYPGPSTPIAGYHELLTLPLDGGQPVSLARVPWFPESEVRLDGGAWLASFDSGLCAWIELVPDTGEPPFAWPLQVTDDGEPFAVNVAALGDTCDEAPLASSIAGGPAGALAFLASGAARDVSGFGRLDLAVNLYRREPDGTIRRLAAGLVHAGGLVWRPGTDVLTAYATIEGRAGIWTFDPDGTRRLIYEGRLLNFAWSPDGLSLAVIVPTGAIDDADPARRLEILSP